MKNVTGKFVDLDGEEFYRIENYDCMEDFFMTITSSSDIWNFCWSKGGVTAGRINADHAIFPYYTADKVSDMKYVTGSRTMIVVREQDGTKFWEPFAPFCKNKNLLKNIYKNSSGTKIWFEEINPELQLSFRYGWTSSAKYGLVKMSCVENLGSSKRKLTVLDGCRNIMPACANSGVQIASSCLLDAYKKTDLDKKSGITLFTMSSVLTDRAEPSEGLLANVSWFSCEGKVFLKETDPELFEEYEGDASKIPETDVLKGERPSCFILREFDLEKTEKWYQCFDTFLSASKIAALKNEISDRKNAEKILLEDIAKTDSLMDCYLAETDGIQDTAEKMTCVHHKANVMFNIMRGGFFADNGKINGPDLIKFIGQRNSAMVPEAEKVFGEYCTKYSVPKNELALLVEKSGNPQLKRLFLEYLPMIFSRRHGDPSRPWNKFNIMLNDKDGNPILNYEGNWRDIFQNWEALAMSYPSYIKNMCAKFVSAMTADGFNPYRISREGVDWECPDPDDPWAMYGYWGDHQVIYLQKFLELWNSINSKEMLDSLDERIFSTANIPYRLKKYEDICKDPRNSLMFDEKLSDSLFAAAKKYGNDKKLLQDKDGNPCLTSLASKILQIVIAKASNLVPGGGIWMNTQRPEWNDANNALAGYGLSVVTVCYLARMLSFLEKVFAAGSKTYTIPSAQKKCLLSLLDAYKSDELKKAYDDDKARKAFTDRCGKIFEAERDEIFVKETFASEQESVSADEILSVISAVKEAVWETIRRNRRSDGLYHTYNTLVIGKDTMSVRGLQEMLEGQVAVISAGLLDSSEVISLLESMKKSGLYEKRQNSYMLYPNKELPLFLEKNNVSEKDLGNLKEYAESTNGAVLEKDINGVWHFNASFRNAAVMAEYLDSMASGKPTAEQKEALAALFEKTFCHQNFTGRSGTFYAYEGLGSIYWHQVSKLLLAVQEVALEACRNNDKNAKTLSDLYYDVRAGLSFNKTPEIYGAFPSDPYSHTPYLKGARQPGMTGQVKEEVLTRWGELGVFISDGKATFRPMILKDSEFKEDGTLSFSWCGAKVSYSKTGKKSVAVKFADGSEKTFDGDSIPQEESLMLFERTGKILSVAVGI